MMNKKGKQKNKYICVYIFVRLKPTMLFLLQAATASQVLLITIPYPFLYGTLLPPTLYQVTYISSFTTSAVTANSVQLFDSLLRLCACSFYVVLLYPALPVLLFQ